MALNDRSPVLGGLTPREFLEKHWQKAPLLVRGAFKDFTPPLSAAELAGLACEDGVESRLVLQTKKAPGWQLRQGPFLHKDFKRLPKTRWTLLVQDVDKHVPAVAELLQPFRFIPDWRIDDLMISYATDGGSVGPHVDAYDVFLLQAEGMRRWDFSTRLHADRPGLPLKQVKDFEPEDSFLLMPGDMLYLPPGVAHHGVAFGECMTCSIGFRAPSQQELLADFAGELMQDARADVRYTDPDLTPVAHPGELGLEARARVRQLLRTQLRPSDEALDIWFGCFITEPKPWLQPLPLTRKLTLARFKERLAVGKALAWHPSVRLAWYDARQTTHLFIDGKHYVLPDKHSAFAELITDNRRLEADALGRYASDAVTGPLLLDIVNAGQLKWTA